MYTYMHNIHVHVNTRAPRGPSESVRADSIASYFQGSAISKVKILAHEIRQDT